MIQPVLLSFLLADQYSPPCAKLKSRKSLTHSLKVSINNSNKLTQQDSTNTIANHYKRYSVMVVRSTGYFN
ncbi:unnamed protein product [Pocillopora meandrina]|uniref:Uncharacterized protein n=1 Tax=Pocillopora meandrina TaxID=46732 RepID=A0AAU9XNG4_9CNID|nr:unnamed protein product [Pocillopora meandrina]